jgi:hypothetical protein
VKKRDRENRPELIGTKNRRPPKKKVEVGAFDRSLIRVTIENFTYGKKLSPMRRNCLLH